jgi:hypothetical protein
MFRLAVLLFAREEKREMDVYGFYLMGTNSTAPFKSTSILNLNERLLSELSLSSSMSTFAQVTPFSVTKL